MPLFFVFTFAALARERDFPNMNGNYVISKTPNPAPGEFSTKWSEYRNEAGGVESFDVYMGPIEHLYGEVFWTELPESPIPQDVVKKLDGKGIAIVGYEVDQVRKGAGPNGEDVSVPINMAYNHHHDATVIGKGSRMEKVPIDPHDTTIPLMQRPHADYVTRPVQHTPSSSGIPTHAHLAAGNGGEYRKSYHGFASPVAYVVESPTSVHVLPMQIDTWNRDKMNISGGSAFVPGPLPKHSLAPEGAQYSGVLECPLTDRVKKNIKGGDGFNSTFAPSIFECTPKQSSCQNTIYSAPSCFDAVREQFNGSKVTISQVTSDDLPSGCTVTGDGENISAVFNTKNTSKCCGSGVLQVRGSVDALVEVDLTVGSTNVNISLAGPDGAWYGVGFFAQAMVEAPYSIIVDGNGAVSERKMANHAAGTLLQPSIRVLSNTVSNGKRTVVISRASKGASPQHASFAKTDLQVNIITALGSTPSLGYHKSKTATTLNLWPTASNEPVCMCELPAAPFGSAQGTLTYLPTGETFGFVNYCQPEPRESILFSKNPTCDVRSYVGGLQVCKHKWSLLDSDTPQPWPNQPLKYYQKYRFYYQTYKPGFHVVSWPREGWGIAAAGGNAEYDVVKCPEGTPEDECKNMIWGVLTPGGDNMHLAAIHFHCHAPTCLAMEIWNNRTGKLLCRQEPIYGGTGKIDLDKYDEPGYIAQPPCLWGYGPGLEPMPLASGVPFMIKAITNASAGHHGEMAFPEVTLVPWNSTSNRPLAGP